MTLRAASAERRTEGDFEVRLVDAGRLCVVASAAVGSGAVGFPESIELRGAPLRFSCQAPSPVPVTVFVRAGSQALPRKAER